MDRAIFGILFNQQEDGGPLSLNLLNNVEDFLDEDWRQAHGWLIHKSSRGLGHEGPAQLASAAPHLIRWKRLLLDARPRLGSGRRQLWISGWIYARPSGARKTNQDSLCLVVTVGNR